MSVFQILSIIRARHWVIWCVMFASIISSMLVVSLLPKRYEATAQILLNVTEGDIITNNPTSPVLVRDLVHTHIEMLKSLGEAIKVVDILSLGKKPEYAKFFKEYKGNDTDIKSLIASSLQKNVAISRVGASQIVNVTARSNDPQSAASIANAFVQAHKMMEVETRVAPALEAGRWFDAQVAVLQKSLNDAQLKRTEARRLADKQDKGVRYVGNDVSGFSRDLADARIELNQARAAAELALSLDIVPADTPETLATQAKVQEIEQQITRETAALGPDHRRVQLLRSNLGAARKVAGEAVALARRRNITATEQARDAAERKLASLNASIDATLNEGDNRSAISAVDREIDAIQSQISALLRRRERVKLDSSVDSTQVVSLTVATPPVEPSFPKFTIAVAAAGALGCMAGMVLLFLLEIFDRRLRSVDDIKLYFDEPLLAIVPIQKNLGFLPNIVGDYFRSKNKFFSSTPETNTFNGR